ncbi:MAG TPA: AraC family transcriptional regulator [Cellvibrio sp.]|nr:AraC family transcriptional regulator [Cellvibrio sp.]
MLLFYRKAMLTITCGLLISLALCYFAWKLAFLHSPLLPAEESKYPWILTTTSDIYWGGKSTITVDEDRFGIDYRFMLDPLANNTTASAAIEFVGQDNKLALVNLNGFEKLKFNVKCTPANTLALAVFIPDERVSKLDDVGTFRFPLTHFACQPNWTEVVIDLRHLETPQWWYGQHNLSLSQTTYDLTKVAKISITNTFQSPKSVESRLQISELNIYGHNWFYLYLVGGLLITSWGGIIFWLFRAHTSALTNDLRERLQKDRPVVAYQALSMEPHKDKESSAVLRLMATEYSNPELSLESAASKLSISRGKINEILKSELGYTFTTYLNRVRLSEAARLLSEKDAANIAEIAYLVGYKNVSYFNKLFKTEYGCTPKVFKEVCPPNEEG